MSSKLSVTAYAEKVGVNPDTGEPYSLAGYEYLAEPMDNASPRMVIQKAAQVGATVMAIMRVMWFMEQCHHSAMYLFPTHRTADRFRRGRFSVMVARSPFFRAMVRGAGGAGHLQVGDVQFYCHGARSRAELMSVPVSYLTLDERDELYHLAGMEGTPWSAVDLARQRLEGQPQSWELSLSTPTIPGYGIATEFAKSDQRAYVVQCPLCSRHTTIDWPQGILGLEGDAARARFGCPRCQGLWPGPLRRTILQQGKWHAAVTQSSIAGYHLTRLHSPVAKASRLAQQWQDAQADPAALQIFHNSVLGLPYLSEGARLEQAVIEQAITRSSGATMLQAAQSSVAGVDVGPHVLHVVIAQPAEDAMRLIWAGVVLDWNELEKLLQTYHVRSLVIDAQPETHQARELVNRSPGGWICYYLSTVHAQPLYDAARKLMRQPRSETLDELYRLWNVGKVIAPVNLPREFSEQLRSLVRVIRQDRRHQPRVDYLEAHGPDHYAHAMNYCLMALKLLPNMPRMVIH